MRSAPPRVPSAMSNHCNTVGLSRAMPVALTFVMLTGLILLRAATAPGDRRPGRSLRQTSQPDPGAASRAS